MMKMILPIFVSCAILFFTISNANAMEYDYCIADPSIPHGPSGYACRATAPTADDFSYSGLRVGGNSSNAFKVAASPASVAQFPALNGMGLSMLRADIEVGGAVPIHTHRVAELVMVMDGSIMCGFIDTNNTAYYKTLEKGDLFVVPPSLEHFLVNVGQTTAVAVASFPSSNPGVQPVSTALFKNDLSSDILQKITLLDLQQIQKLKKLFGGSNY